MVSHISISWLCLLVILIVDIHYLTLGQTPDNGSITNPLSFLVVRIVTVVLLRIVKGLATRQPDTMTVVKRELDHVSGGGATDPDDPKSKNHYCKTNGYLVGGRNGHGDRRSMTDCKPAKQRTGVRIFRPVESLTNHLVATDRNFQSIYDAVMMQMVVFIVYVCLRESMKAGRLHFDVFLLYNGFGSGKTFIILEVYLLASFLLVYPLFKLWRVLYTTNVLRQLISFTFVLLFVCYILSSGFIVAQAVFSVPLPPFTTIVVAVEQLRLSMKAYSFVRENAYKVLYPWHKDDDFGPAVWYAGQMSPQVGSFSQYLYFLFAPTLLYRDHYPRNEGPIKWENVLVYFTQFVTTVWYLGVIGKDFTFPSSMGTIDLIRSYFNCVMASFFGLLLVHTCLFHGYMNFMSELMRFADREFYQDWWASASFSSYYRKWNMVVYDWVYSYLYSDMKSIFQSPLVAVFATIFVSGFVHEYLLSLALKFAAPILLLEFAGLGVIFYIVIPFGKTRISNIFVLFGLTVGGGSMIFYYQAELAARIYCPEELTLATFFRPRLFQCYFLYNN